MDVTFRQCSLNRKTEGEAVQNHDSNIYDKDKFLDIEDRGRVVVRIKYSNLKNTLGTWLACC